MVKGGLQLPESPITETCIRLCLGLGTMGRLTNNDPVGVGGGAQWNGHIDRTISQVESLSNGCVLGQAVMAQIDLANGIRNLGGFATGVPGDIVGAASDPDGGVNWIGDGRYPDIALHWESIDERKERAYEEEERVHDEGRDEEEI